MLIDLPFFKIRFTSENSISSIFDEKLDLNVKLR